MATIPQLRPSMKIASNVWLLCSNCGQIVTTSNPDTEYLKPIVDENRPFRSGWDVVCPECRTTIRCPFWLNHPGPEYFMNFILYLYCLADQFFPPKR